MDTKISGFRNARSEHYGYQYNIHYLVVFITGYLLRKRYGKAKYQDTAGASGVGCGAMYPILLGSLGKGCALSKKN